LTKQKIYWICQIGGWSSYGLFNLAIFSLTSGKIGTYDFIGAVYQIIIYIFSTHGLRWIIKKRGWIVFSSLRLIPLIIFSNLLLGIANYVLLLGLSFLMGTLMLSVEFKTINLFLGILGPAAMYFLWSLIYFTYHYFEQYNKSLKYEAVIRDTELNYLRSQLNPHFIFNALNSIRALIDENPKKSKVAITQLSGLIRNSLQSDRQELVRLEEEIQMVEDYLGLESIRFEERLDTKIEMDQHTKYYKIPPMMIQTLVENGIKHGISKEKNGGFIEVKTFLESDFLFIQIRNTGVYLESHQADKKFGLSNTRKRLELIYGEHASFHIFNEKENIVLMEILLPRDPINENNTN
jgi:sensor histidine kinase YesM